MSLVSGSVSWFTEQFNRGNSLQLAIVVYVIAIILCVLIYYTNGDKYINSCVIKLSGRKEDYTLWLPYLDIGRGDEYFIGRPDNEDKRKELKDTADMCPVTIWPILHFVLYVILGFLMPKFFWQLFLIGIIWELAEWFWKCQCVLDIAWNLGGLIVGVVLRRRLFPYT